MRKYFIYLTSLIIFICSILSGCDINSDASQKPTKAPTKVPVKPWPTPAPLIIRPEGNIIWASDCDCGCGTVEENIDSIYEDIEKAYPNYIYITILGKEYGMWLDRKTTKKSIDAINRDYLIGYYTFIPPEENKDADDMRPYEKYAYFDKHGVLQRLTFKTRYNPNLESDEKAFALAEVIAKERADIADFEKNTEAKENYWKVEYKSVNEDITYCVTIDATKDISMPSFAWWVEGYKRSQESIGDGEISLAEKKLAEIVDATVQHVSKNQMVEEVADGVEYDFFITSEYELAIKYTINLTLQSNGHALHKIDAYYYTKEYINR